jgi:hypothetical protein
VLVEEGQYLAVAFDLVLLLAETVALVVEHDVFHRHPVLLHRGDDVEPFGALLFIFAKGLPVLLVGIWIWRMALAQQAAYLEQVARHFLPEPALIGTEERATLTGLGSRRRQRKALAKSHGRRAAWALHSLQQAQLALLVACARHGRGPLTFPAEMAVSKARARLDACIASASMRHG